ncbi:serine palmitoyltransferase 1 [Pogonomyrmex barbatus]|uniref:Serine palmitoyltransferase 1 n=1 Tax=Pogonomyrmex barbatus TaxID=144034 RepID=A0A6I9VVN0_9HYME|nr:serine palmitoyltransferase 1 [Pogonomyrmex barbatus]
MSTKFLFVESMEILRDTLPHYHILLITVLLLSIVWFISKRRININYHNSTPSKELVESKLTEWQPEFLVPEPPAKHPSLSPKQITSRIGKRVIVNGKNCLNLGTHNYLGLSDNMEIIESAVAAVKKYGVGSCGPRGFYGTVDVHLELEERLAKFMNMEEAIIYSYGFSTIASAIPAYCKRNDLIFVDEQVNFAIQKGLDASRGNIQYFKHNDVQDFHNLLMKQDEIDKKNPKKAAKIKRFLIIEGIYMNTGNICPLPELVDLCKKYKLRIFIDESISFGTIGQGKGVTEYFNIPRSEIDMIMGSLECAIGSIGGFCVGTSFVIDHQRLSGLGYCFSASQPPLLASAAITSLDIIENNPQIFHSLKNNSLLMDKGLKEISMLECLSFAESPLKHVYLKEKKDYVTEEKLLSTISNKCIENNLAVILPAYLSEAERMLPRPSLRLCISASLDHNDIKFALNTLKKCTEEVLSSIEKIES